MDLIVKKASALTTEQKTILGLLGTPSNWPIESYPYTGSVPEFFEQMTEEAFNLLKANNQAAYDAWIASLRPIINTPPPAPQEVNVLSSPSFAAKTMVIGGVTKKLFKRVTGIKQSLSVGLNTFTYTIPFPWVKITGLEIINSENLDSASFYVLDTATGTYSTISNYTLNRFAYDAYLCKDYYEHKSEFDADLYQNMQIKIDYTSISAKDIGINFILNEVKN
jgi:hypothetical protein